MRLKSLICLQAHIREATKTLEIQSTTFRFQRDAVVTPKRRKVADSDDIITEMFCPFVRSHYLDSGDIPKVTMVVKLVF